MQPNPVKEALELAVGYITDAMAEAQAEYELNAPYPLRAKQFEARLESINADLEKVQRALTQPAIPEGWAYSIGQRVQKKSGGSWHGTVVGFYTASLTPRGYAVESEREEGSVQIYPEAALEAAPVAGNLEG